ncbi:diguanylate cyclase [Chitinivorax sp. PXF-14]|uniref:diguanylate cyclase domain-containing protein n=1 Tax=Chitinivorax sp. PXF-14 TaxID=3230488 RepID=UPI0034663BB8
MDSLAPLAAYLETHREPAFLQDASGCLLAVNEAFCRFTLTPRAKLIGRRAGGDAMPLPAWADGRAVFVTGEEQEVVDHFRLPDGRAQSLVTQKHLITLPDGKRILAGRITPTAEIVSDEQDERLFRVIAEATPFPLLLVSAADLVIVAVNQRAAEYFGQTAVELIGQSFESRFVMAQVCRQLLLMLKTQGAVRDEECGIRGRNGQTCWVQLAGRKTSHGDGSLLLFALHDITERKRADAALRDSEARLRAILDTTSEGFVQYDLVNGLIVDVNEAMCRLTGYPREALLGRPPADFVDEPSRQTLSEQLALAGREHHRQFELTLYTREGEARVLLVNASTRFDAEQHPVFSFCLITDITERKLNEERVLYLAFYDTLTALPNRFLFQERIDQALLQQKRQGGLVALMFVDLDDFKLVNDTLGHDCGDQLLREVARRLNACVRRSDTVARLGGDEFVLLLPNLKAREDAILVARKVVTSLTVPVLIEDQLLTVSLSLGVALCPDDGNDPDLLRKKADMAMYAAKRAGKNQFRLAGD